MLAEKEIQSPAPGLGWSGCWQWIQEHWRTRRRSPRRQLRLCEMLSLGEKRFVAVVECGCQRYLLGGSSSSVELLTELPASAATATGQAGTE